MVENGMGKWVVPHLLLVGAVSLVLSLLLLLEKAFMLSWWI
jgi:hypothetical protein